jgi:hypothetical protein
MDATFISLISACTALTASLLGPLVALTVAKRQIHASVVSTNRQKWIDGFRDLMSGFTGQAVVGLHVRDSIMRDGRIDLGENQALMARFESLVATATKIHLMIDPTDPTHQELLAAVDSITRKLGPEFMTADVQAEIEAALTRAVGLTQGILRTEWARTRKGE